jgi:hypothetical protein
MQYTQGKHLKPPSRAKTAENKIRGSTLQVLKRYEINSFSRTSLEG